MGHRSTRPSLVDDFERVSLGSPSDHGEEKWLSLSGGGARFTLSAHRHTKQTNIQI